jgi:hypothetical protein
MLRDEEEHPPKNPFSSQCTAHSKRTGRRCRRMALGGGVCASHGGAARQVREKREQRLVVLEARQQHAQFNGQGSAWAQDGRPVRLAEELIISAMHDADEVLQAIKRQMAASEAPAVTLTALGEWIDRLSRVAKVVTDGGLQDRLEQRRAAVAREQADQLIAAMDRLITDPRVHIDGDPRQVVLDALRPLEAA